MSEFTYEPSPYVPFRDREVLERVRAIKREDMEKHPNPDFKIRILSNGAIETIWLADMLRRIYESDRDDKRCVMILPNPVPLYEKIACFINALKIDCRNLFVFAMDEYADQDGHIAPSEWRFGFGYAMMNYLYYKIDPALRPTEKRFVCFTTGNVNDYSKMIEDAGGADICYTGPGWTGHLAFIEPDAPEFDAPLDEWRKMGARIVTLSPFTLAQNSLHGSFGMSGDLSIVPPRAATIGPKDVIASRNRMDFSTLGVHGTTTSWQRMITRLCTHGPVTPKLPTSIHQELRSDKYISEEVAMDIEPDWEKGY